jgi:hypothetical protein
MVRTIGPVIALVVSLAAAAADVPGISNTEAAAV